MTDELKILSLDEIEAKSPTTKIVELPDLSEEIGETARVKIKKIEPLDLLSLYDFPMDEVNAAVQKGDDSVQAMVSEQTAAFNLEDQVKMLKGLIKASVIEPTKVDKLIKRLSMNDLNFLGGAVLEFTTPGSTTAGAARFPDDGELGGD